MQSNPPLPPPVGQLALTWLVDEQDSALQLLSLSFPPSSSLYFFPVLLLGWCNFCLPAQLPSLFFFLFPRGLLSLHAGLIIWFFDLSLLSPLPVTGRCGLRTGVSQSPLAMVSVEFPPVSHTALPFRAFRHGIKEVCHATSWIRNGVWLPFVLHRNLALGRPSA